jgi:elongation factor G
VPVLCGSAFKNKGVQPLLDAVVDYLPSPLDVPAIQGLKLDGETEDTRPADDNAPFAALAFKIMNDPFVGTLTFARIYSGKLETASMVTNSVKDKKEKVGRMLLMHANSREDIQEALCRRHRRSGGPEGHDHRRHAVRAVGPIILERMEFPDPSSNCRWSPRPSRTRRRWASRSIASPARIRPSASRPITNRARPSSRGWASSTSRSWSTA